MAHHGKKAALEQIRFLCQTLSLLSHFLRFQGLMIEFDILLKE